MRYHDPHGRLLTVLLGGIAEFERELIRARTGEGRKRAKARGVRFGRPPKLTPHQRQEAMQRLAAGETQADVARTYAVDASTISRLLGDRPFPGAASLGGLPIEAPPLDRLLAPQGRALVACRQNPSNTLKLGVWRDALTGGG